MDFDLYLYCAIVLTLNSYSGYIDWSLTDPVHLLPPVVAWFPNLQFQLLSLSTALRLVHGPSCMSVFGYTHKELLVPYAVS